MSRARVNRTCSVRRGSNPETSNSGLMTNPGRRCKDRPRWVGTAHGPRLLWICIPPGLWTAAKRAQGLVP